MGIHAFYQLAAFSIIIFSEDSANRWRNSDLDKRRVVSFSFLLFDYLHVYFLVYLCVSDSSTRKKKKERRCEKEVHLKEGKRAAIGARFQSNVDRSPISKEPE